MCLRRAPEKYIAGAALDRADIDAAVELMTPILSSPQFCIPARSVLN
jgi:hypothetical protein